MLSFGNCLIIFGCRIVHFIGIVSFFFDSLGILQERLCFVGP